MPAQLTHFWLNNEEVLTSQPPGTLLLDFLRFHRQLTGTKEGCKEGDCGACTVLVGRLQGRQLQYRPETSCLIPLGEMHGKHVVTVEGLNTRRLNPVQDAIVEEGASQCGFCTPGIVVSLTGLLLAGRGALSTAAVRCALSGHLCRCTGYRSLKAVYDRLASLPLEWRGPEELIQAGYLPAYFQEMPERLQAIEPREEVQWEGLPVAGGTDLYVQRGEQIPEQPVQLLRDRPELLGIAVRNGFLDIGAATTFEDFAAHPEVQRVLPEIQENMFLVASWQLRHRATLGGNLVNASPIADLTILLLALDAQLLLTSPGGQRVVPLTRFYRGYKQLNLEPGELVTRIRLPIPPEGTRIHWEKVSKRRCLDIASVNSAIRLQVENGRIVDAALSMGGVAPVPLYLKKTSRWLRNRPVTLQTVRGAQAHVQQEISPISDIRGSAAYKRLLAHQLVLAHFAHLFPEQIHVRQFYEAS